MKIYSKSHYWFASLGVGWGGGWGVGWGGGGGGGWGGGVGGGGGMLQIPAIETHGIESEIFDIMGSLIEQILRRALWDMSQW